MKREALAFAVATGLVVAAATAITGSHHAPSPHPTTTKATRTSGCRPGAEPDPRCTPGALNPAVTPATMRTTICHGGWTATVRPSAAVSARLKRQVATAYGITGSVTGYEGDHLVPLELGGATADVRNLWPEPHAATGPDGGAAGSFEKDAYENWLNFEVCRGRLHLPLATAQARMASDWYGHYVADGRPADPYKGGH